MALAIQTSWLVSNPYAFQADDLLLKEDVVVWLEELITNDPYPSKSGLTTAFKEAVLTYVVWMDWKNRCIACLVAECFKGSAGSLAAHSPQGFGLDTKAAGQAANICLQCLTHCRQKKKHITTGRRSSMGVQRLVNLMKAAGGHDSPRQC